MVAEEVPGKYLIIGGLGYIGSHLANYINERDCQSAVVLYDRVCKNSNLSRISLELRASNVFTLIVGDVSNEELLTKTMNEHQVSNLQ